MKALLDWLDQRTGCRRLLQRFLFESIPGGARWRHAWGAALIYAFGVQVVTGFFLWTGYSPSGQTAWESVYYIQHEMFGGWLLRGLHHYTAQAFVVLLVLHLFQMILFGAYRAPRELTFWLALLLVPLAITISAAGWLLPYDQRGFWASRVPINLLGALPVLGPVLQKLAMGGADFGHHTLTRFFALHAGLLPPVIAFVLGLHFYLTRRYGLADPGTPGRTGETYWPDQFLRNALLSLAVLAVAVGFTLLPWLIDPTARPGVELGAPADPSEQYSAARPEWFMLFLFQFLKYFPGGTEIWGAVIIPGVVMTVIALMPFWARGRLGHRFNVGFVCALGVGIVSLIVLARSEDRQDAIYQSAVADARRSAERMQVLAGSPAGIPNSGALTLLRNDPLTQGPKLFAKHCASCHRYDGHDGLGRVPTKDPQSAADLSGFATRAWLSGWLNPERIGTTNYFGATRHKDGKMVKFVQKDFAHDSEEQRQRLRKVVAALSAEAQLRAQLEADQRDAALIREGRKLIAGEMRCTECHQFRKKDEDATAPDLTGYGSRDWLVGIIRNPAHPRYYGKRNDRMPAFGTGASQILSAREIYLLADWLRGQWYEPAQPSGTRPAQVAKKAGK